MNVIALESLELPLQQTAVAIGVFDGVHRGHQEILRQTVREARSQGLLPVALTFDIHPTALFAPAQAPASLVTLAQRMKLVEEYGGGIGAVVVAHFDAAFAAMAPGLFVSNVLEGALGARHVLVGADFCYGRGRMGNVTTLMQAGALNDFAVTIVPPFLIHDERVSSTQIRRLISLGRLPEATKLLGHPFVVEGHVVQGKQIGRTLGYPTANLVPTQRGQLLPGPGIYAAYAHLSDGSLQKAAVSIGVNPTVDSANTIQTVEAYLMDGFHGDLYGQALSVDFRLKIRDEAKFSTLDALIVQMEQDVHQISALLD